MSHLLWLIVAVVTFGWVVNQSEVAAMPTDTIYTSLPDPHDAYYRPFHRDLAQFNTQLQHQLRPGDAGTALSATPQTYHTTRFAYPDIWLRDVAPVITTRMVKFTYAPHYLKAADRRYLNDRFIAFLNHRFTYQRSRLVLDGGNLQWNGHDTVILTRQVLHDNPFWSRRAITRELQTKLNVRHVIYISKEPGDILGHADGMVKFNGPHQLYINDFSYAPGFRQRVEREIRAVDPAMQFITLPSAYTDRGQYDKKIASARGLYVNMLTTPHAVYVPQYGLPADQRVLRIIRQHSTLPVIPVNIGRLATTGGSLHCLTWDVPQKFIK